MPDGVINAAVRKDVACISLRGDPGDAKFCKTVEAVLDQPLPTEPNKTSSGEHRVYWLGPDEWLVTTDINRRDDILVGLAESLSSMHVAVNDLTGGNVVLQLAGANTRDVLAKGCTLDFHPGVFKLGDCAQSGLGKANVLIGLADDEPTFDVIVRRSFSSYLLQWLQHAGHEYSIEFR